MAKMARLADFAESANYAGTGDQAKTIKTGFMQAALDISLGAAYVPTDIGHIFGRMGVGARTTPGSSEVVGAFQWATPTNDHAMMVSMFPTEPGAAGLTSGQMITIEASEVAFVTLNTIVAPVRPAAATPADTGAVWVKTASIMGVTSLIAFDFLF